MSGVRTETTMIFISASSDLQFHRNILAALGEGFGVESIWQIGYSDTSRLRTVPSDQKCILIVDFEDPRRALPLVRSVGLHPDFACLAIGGGGTREDVLQLMQAGIREILPSSDAEEVRQAVRRIKVKMNSTTEVLAELYAFLPAKPGCGATTLATYAASAAAEMSGEPTLLLDFDVRLGVTSFLLKAGGNHDIVDALVQSENLDTDLWASLVSQCGSLHLVGSGPIQSTQQFSAERFMQILQFARQLYSIVAVDLPGTMDDHEIETLHRSKRIYLVCTPDIGALHVARRKSAWLRDLGLIDRVSVVLNNVHRSALSMSDIESIILMSVDQTVPFDAPQLARAAQNGTAVMGTSPLAKAFQKIAIEMLPLEPANKKVNLVRRFVEYFSISPARGGRRP